MTTGTFTDDWRSVYLGNLICADDFKHRDSAHPDHRTTFAHIKKTYKDKRKNSRFWIQEYAYAVFRPSSRKVGQIVDISRRGLSFRCPDTGEEQMESSELDIFLVGDNFHLDKVPFKPVSQRNVGTELPDDSGTMKQWGVEFGELTSEQIAGLDTLIERYTSRSYR